ncbi:MAG TPA: hypothetical protein VFE38_09885 [Edaphobacter sp.]|nr:hypothetical protein [Edaphobacter sp.]
MPLVAGGIHAGVPAGPAQYNLHNRSAAKSDIPAATPYTALSVVVYLV